MNGDLPLSRCWSINDSGSARLVVVVIFFAL
jgi:hypothetical protein